MAESNLTAARLRELLDYNPEAGVFTWKVGRYCGRRAGTVVHNGYRRIRIANKCCTEHRLAWLHVHGEWPGHLDHINGVRADNRLCNLRECSFAENSQNRHAASSRSKTGLLGIWEVTYRSGVVRWYAAVKADGRRRYLGVFETPEAAHEAYVLAKRELHSFCTI